MKAIKANITKGLQKRSCVPVCDNSGAKIIRIIPRAIDSSTSPLDVSREIAVVIVLVKPLILPPTIKDSPTSEIARPNPMSTAASIANRASLMTIVVD